MGEAFIMASAQTILFSLYPPEKHGLAMGIYAMGVSFAPSLGPTVGGWITEHLAWRWVFYINLPTGILNFVAAVFFLPVIVRHREKLHFNFISYFFIATFTISLLVLLSKGQQLGWGQSNLIVLLGAVASISLITIPLGISLGSFFAPVSAHALGKLGPYTSQGVSIMHYLRFLGGSLGTAMATNTLELRQAVHYEGISALQNHGYVQEFITSAGNNLSAFMPSDIAVARAHGLLIRIQSVKALSLSFQDTFRHTSFFGALGSIFLLLMILDARRKKQRGAQA